MNGKQAKKIRQIASRNMPNVVQMFNELKTWPFRQRLKMAWLLLRGPKKPINPRG
jgi:hypothetical protein